MRKMKGKLVAAPLAAAMLLLAAPAASASEAEVLTCRDIFSDRICDIVEGSISDPKPIIDQIRCWLNPDCPW